ncbi:hypothetical protein QJS10_CPA16g01020 [Acorus calamus]|uniref:Uncharacterized protein n=1 Tax=Acorus calamus TaxID=4465 RepID=A0AAV9CZF2_ACOCL|nr:hypothetical protein QJS10_CPA16g01020 [Acorus calamus]
MVPPSSPSVPPTATSMEISPSPVGASTKDGVSPSSPSKVPTQVTGLLSLPPTIPVNKVSLSTVDPSLNKASSSKGILPTPTPKLYLGESSMTANPKKGEPMRPRRNKINVPLPGVSEEVKLWSSFFSSSDSKRPQTSVEFYAPEVDCSKKVAVLEEDEVSEAEEAWGFILVAGEELPDEVFVQIRNGDREAIRVTYDWKPEACKFCNTFGHDEALCCKKPRFTKAISQISSENGMKAAAVQLDDPPFIESSSALKPALANSLPAQKISNSASALPSCPNPFSILQTDISKANTMSLGCPHQFSSNQEGPQTSAMTKVASVDTTPSVSPASGENSKEQILDNVLHSPNIPSVPASKAKKKKKGPSADVQSESSDSMVSLTGTKKTKKKRHLPSSGQSKAIA